MDTQKLHGGHPVVALDPALLGLSDQERAERMDSIRRRFHAESQWLDENHAAYAGQWVAIRGNELLGAATEAGDLARLLEGPNQPTIHFVDPWNGPVAGW